MRVSPCFLAFFVAVIVAFSVPVFAQQPAAAVDDAACAAQLAAIEQDMNEARNRGRMLRRQQLENQLMALQARCNATPAQASRAASIATLEQEVQALRDQLARAEEQLRKLRNASP